MWQPEWHGIGLAAWLSPALHRWYMPLGGRSVQRAAEHDAAAARQVGYGALLGRLLGPDSADPTVSARRAGTPRRSLP